MRNTTSTERIEAMVQRIEPTWTVLAATPAVGGYHLVYKLRVDTGDGQRRCVLKATPPDMDPVCGDETRLLSVLESHASARVPHVLGVVDSDETLPAPFFLAEEVRGANYQRDELRELPTKTLERGARSLGEQLAALHRTSIDGDLDLPGYGFVDINPDRALDGGRPSDSPAQVTVADPETDWRTYLHGTVDHTIGALADSPFAGLADEVEAVLYERIDRLSGTFSPTLCRVDHSIENTVLDPETDEIQAFLDWEFCVAATPAYDLAFAVHSFDGGLYTLLPEVPDRNDRIETALLAGYRAVGGEESVEGYRANGGCYRLLSDLHAMANFQDWFERSTASESQREAAVDPLRERVRERLRAYQ